MVEFIARVALTTVLVVAGVVELLAHKEVMEQAPLAAMGAMELHRPSLDQV
jgi:hypothetical protein